MFLKTVLASWFVHQIFHLSHWSNVGSQGNIDVISQNTEKDSKRFLESIYDNYLAENCSDTNGTIVRTACENCGCLSGIARIALPRSTECEITSEILEEIYSLILAAYEKAITPPDPVNKKLLSKIYFDDDPGFCQNLTDICSNNFNKHSNRKLAAVNQDQVCDQLVEEIKEVISLVTDEIELLVLSIFDPAGLLIKIGQLQNCVNCLRNDLADLVEKAANETARCYEDGLGRVYTCFTTELGKRTERIMELEKRVALKSFDIIISSVLAGNYSTAAKEYEILNDDTFFDKMMLELFESKQLDHILRFGRTIHHNNITGRFLVYEKINQLINISEPNYAHNIMFRSFLVRDRVQFCGSENFCFELGLPLGFANLMRDVLPRAKQSIDIWANDVRRGDFINHIKTGSPEFVNLIGESFYDAIDELVTTAYSKDKNNLDNTLNFVSNLRWNNQSFKGFETILREASSVGVEDQLRIAMSMKDKMENLRGPDGQETLVRSKFLDLKDNKIKANVRAIVWDEYVSFEAVEFSSRFLFVDNNLGFQAGNRQVKTKDGQSDSTKWKLEKVEGGKNSYEFRIINYSQNEYLGPHIPWRYQSWGSVGYELACTTKADHFEPERKHYNSEIRFDGLTGDDQVALFHVGRQAYLHANSDGSVYLAMFGKMSGNTRWRIRAQ